mmetsp:Transcript_27501/g.68985  ORF Transcript_27501/g.68985 Transcript_27501/m.68985 type:complete len:109 (-) Transcript_27501:390-716(-)
MCSFASHSPATRQPAASRSTRTGTDRRSVDLCSKQLMREGAVEPVWGVVRQLQPRNGASVHVARIKNDVLCFVRAGVVHLCDDPSIILLHAPLPGNEDGLPNHTAFIT